VDSSSEWSFISQHVAENQRAEDFYVFTLRMCDTRLDTDIEKMSPTFIQQFVDCVNAKSIPLIKNHDISDVDNVCGMVYRAEVVTDETELDELGLPVTYALGYVFTTAASETKTAVETGRFTSVSCSFKAGEYEDMDGYKLLLECKEALEMSFVVLPAQEMAGVITKSLIKKGGNVVGKQTEPVVKITDAAVAETKAAPIKGKSKEVEPTIETLQAEIADLKAKLLAVESDNITSALSKGIDGLNPMNDKVKQLMLKEADMSRLSYKDGEVVGLEDMLAELADSFESLLNADSVAEVAEAAEEVDEVADAVVETATESMATDGGSEGTVKSKAAPSEAARLKAKKALGDTMAAKFLVNRNTKNREQLAAKLAPKSNYSKRGF
jgi:hypothetical protein